MPKKHVVVVGAGIAGTSSAIWLRRAGLDVTLIDKSAAGQGASFGNGGILARCSIVPVTTPGLLRKAPGYLMDSNFPLYMRWRYLPRMLPWLAKFLSHANAADTRRIANGLSFMLGDSVEQHQSLTRGTPAEKWVATSEYNFAYSDRAAFEADGLTWDLRREAGFSPEIIEGAAVQEHEPILGSDVKLLAVNKDHGFIRDPGSYVAALASLFVEMGGRLAQAEVMDFDISGGSVRAVETDKGRFDCDQVVLAAGIWSKPLMMKLGLNVPLEAERGYHILFKDPTETPRSPMMIAAGKFVATPMNQGLRCAGIVEFGGLDETKSPAPLNLLRKSVARVFPNMRASAEEEWLGFRPSPTDSLPLIGQLRDTGVFTAFGHQHIGMTSGPKTGRLVANLISGDVPNADLSPFDPMRFA